MARPVTSKGARKVVLAVPVCSSQTVEILREELDDVICLSETDTLVAVGNWYQDFHQVSDAEVLGLLKGTPRP